MGQGNFPLPLDFQVSHQYLTDIYSFFKVQSFLKNQLILGQRKNGRKNGRRKGGQKKSRKDRRKEGREERRKDGK